MKYFSILIGISLCYFLFSSCGQSNEKQLLDETNSSKVDELVVAAEDDVDKEDTIISNGAKVAYTPSKVGKTPVLEDAVEYFRENNKFKDWDVNDKRSVLVKCMVRKNGVKEDFLIQSCGEKKLDDEALRLIKNGKVIPGENLDGELIDYDFAILVPFPAE